MLLNKYLWHIHMDNNTTSLSMFNDNCQNVLKRVGSRIVSIRISLRNVINGWPIISSSLHHHQTTLLRHLHLIDIEPGEFNKLINNRFVKQLHTLVIELTKDSVFHSQREEGAYLAKVCLQLPDLRICRLPFDFCRFGRENLSNARAPLLMNLPNISSTVYLHTLSVGIKTFRFLERLVICIPNIQNLSFGIQHEDIYEDENLDLTQMPSPIDARQLRYLFRLSMNCEDKISFHKAVALLSSIFGQLTYLSLKLLATTSISDRLIITVHVKNDLEEKKILNSFLNAPFVNQSEQRSKKIIQEIDDWSVCENSYCFTLSTLPHNEIKIPSYLFPTKPNKTYEKSMEAIDLFPHANELVLRAYKQKNCFSEFGNCQSFTSSSIPWTLIRKISIEEDVNITAIELESILQMASHVHTLSIADFRGYLPRAILHNHNDLGTRVNKQIDSFDTDDCSLRLHNAKDFCKLISYRLPNLKELSFSIYEVFREKDKSTKKVIDLTHFLVDHLQQLVFLSIIISSETNSKTRCFPHKIRRQLYEQPLNRSYRLQCSSQLIQIWL
ncbi:unnamed protein product [Adineta steineri]|uniref:Uncharacterized protein n=1 Tax=Adineta steineri TaxID=433720 RepID=A0A815AAY1_9BILA|nr:unnamed protein product [Adineta steineri]CAF1545439.1 unnamed protein product [Adineta steineri]